MAQIRQDFILDSDGDFPLEDTVINGVYLNTPYGNSDLQHIEDIIIYNFGSIKEWLDIGFGVYSFINSENQEQKALSQLKIQMSKDEYKTSSRAIVSENGGGFTINTKYITRP